MAKRILLLLGASVIALVFASTAIQSTHVTQVTLCQVSSEGKTQTLTVTEEAARSLVAKGAWEAACGLRRAASLEGRVTDSAGRPLGGVCVNVLVSADGRDIAANVTRTNKAGAFQIWVPLQGKARLLFLDVNAVRQFEPEETFKKCFQDALLDYVPEYYRDVPGPGHNFGDAEPIPLAEGGRVTGLDAALSRYGTISGRVTDETTGLPLHDICVEAGFFGVGTLTRTDGTYTLFNVVPGTVHLVFGSECDPPTSGVSTYFPEWYDNKPDEASADPINVGDDENVTINDVALRRAGSISGFVTDEQTALPVEDLFVVIYDHVTQEVVRFVSVFSTDGSYSAGVFASGQYDVEFGSFSGYLGEWYDNQSDQASATPVSVVVGIDTPGINAALTPEP